MCDSHSVRDELIFFAHFYIHSHVECTCMYFQSTAALSNLKVKRAEERSTSNADRFSAGFLQRNKLKTVGIFPSFVLSNFSHTHTAV